MTWRLLRPIWRLDGVTAHQRFVLLALASFTDQRGGNAYPSQSTLARMCCCDRRTVQRAMKSLVERGLITPTGKGRKGTIRYAVNVTPDNAGAAQGPGSRRHSALRGGGTESYNPSNSNPSNSNPGNLREGKEGGLVIDRFSDLKTPTRHHPDSVPDTPWAAVERSRRSRRR